MLGDVLGMTKGEVTTELDTKVGASMLDLKDEDTKRVIQDLIQAIGQVIEDNNEQIKIEMDNRHEDL